MVGTMMLTLIPSLCLCLLQLEEDELKGVPVLVFANKQDLPRAMSVGEITEALRLSGVQQPVRTSAALCGHLVLLKVENDL